MSDVTLRNAAVDGATGDLETAWFAIHDGATSGDQVSNERLQPTYDAAASSTADLTSDLSFTGSASASVSHLGVWDASTAGSLRFVVTLTGDLAFNANGDLDLVSADVTVSDDS